MPFNMVENKAKVSKGPGYLAKQNRDITLGNQGWITDSKMPLHENSWE